MRGLLRLPIRLRGAEHPFTRRENGYIGKGLWCMLVAAADGAIMAGPDGATLPTVDGSEWTIPKANWLQKENRPRWGWM